MNIRQAILSAADSIEQHPHLFDFSSFKDPDVGCGTPGCALGWIATHAGITDWHHTLNVKEILNVGGAEFYSRMNRLTTPFWHTNANECVKALRLYVDAHHPEEQDYIPASIRAIFDVPEQVRATI